MAEHQVAPVPRLKGAVHAGFFSVINAWRFLDFRVWIDTLVNTHPQQQHSVAILAQTTLAQVATVAQTIRCDSQFTRVEGVLRPRDNGVFFVR